MDTQRAVQASALAAFALNASSGAGRRPPAAAGPAAAGGACSAPPAGCADPPWLTDAAALVARQRQWPDTPPDDLQDAERLLDAVAAAVAGMSVEARAHAAVLLELTASLVGNGHSRLPPDGGSVPALVAPRAAPTDPDARREHAAGNASGQTLAALSARLAWEQEHDALTGLLTRRAFERRLHAAVRSGQAGRRCHVLLYIDIDQFKVVNTTSGHAAGDALLVAVADCLRACLPGTTLARLGGDEFGVIIEDVPADAAARRAEGLLRQLRKERFVWAGRPYALTASIGVVVLDATMLNADSAMRQADAACYAAKEAGRNRVLEYELSNRRIMHRHGVMEWVRLLDSALDENRLVLKCQPILALTESADAGPWHEVLLTIQEELGELMPPREFILAAEAYSRMTAIDRQVVSRALQWLSEHGNDSDVGTLSINISGHSINDEDFVDHVLEQFASTRVAPSRICFEITETAAIAHLGVARSFMNRLRIIGCRFALDDFGAGLSSYAYLRNLPVDYVKIDGAFVKGLVHSSADGAVVRSISELGHAMGKRIIAEQVEDDATLERVRAMGVDFVQGFAVGKPRLLDTLCTSLT